MACSQMRIRIDGELLTVDEVRTCTSLPMVRCGREEYYLAESSEKAGEAARERWADMAENDPREFEAMVGAETLVKWCLGQYAGPGSTQVKSLQEWLDLTADHPEEEFASYDGHEREVERVGRLQDELGFCPTMAYRAN